MATTRRDFLRGAIAVGMGFQGLRTLLAIEPRFDEDGAWTAPGFGPLIKDPGKIIDLPAGFSYRVISRMGERMDDGFFVPGQPDGMAAFTGPNGLTLLVRNHELATKAVKKSPFGPKNELITQLPDGMGFDRGHGRTPCIGGTTTLVYDTGRQRLLRQFLSLACTEYNCAGGPTPWSTWISCEETTNRAGEIHEHDHGYPFEVRPTVEILLTKPVPIKAMGRFRREAVAIDPRSGMVYQTEDLEDGLVYRYVPNKPGELLAGGRVQALCVRERRSLDTRNWPSDGDRPASPRIDPGARFAVSWIDLDEVHAPEDDLRLRGYSAGAARFARGEGMWWGNDAVYFACTNGGRIRRGQIWRYTPSLQEGKPGEGDEPGVLELFVEPNNAGLIDNADNLTVAPWGDIVVCEDGSGDQFLVGVTPDGKIYKIGRNAANDSEFAGATFSPDGTTLFVNLQDGGMTLAISGPWRRLT